MNKHWSRLVWGSYVILCAVGVVFLMAGILWAAKHIPLYMMVIGGSTVVIYVLGYSLEMFDTGCIITRVD